MGRDFAWGKGWGFCIRYQLEILGLLYYGRAVHRLLVKGNVDGAAMLFLWAIVDIHDCFQGWTDLPVELFKGRSGQGNPDSVAT